MDEEEEVDPAWVTYATFTQADEFLAAGLGSDAVPTAWLDAYSSLAEAEDYLSRGL